jgi:amidohydrolase
VTAAQSIVSRETRPGERLVLSIGAIEGSTVANILVEKVVLRGTLRWFSSTERDRALARLEALMHGVCQGLRARGELHLTAGTPVTVNQPEAVEVLREALADCGRAELVDPGPMMVSDDVARLLERAPGAYFLVGARGSGAPHHHPEFEIDERVLGLICELLVRSALTYLKGPH